MDTTKGFTHIITTPEGVNDQLELCKKLLERLNTGNVRGVILTIAEQPKAEELSPEQLAELAAENMQPGDATRVSHVLVGPIDTLVYLFKATGHCIYTTYQAATESGNGATKQLH